MAWNKGADYAVWARRRRELQRTLQDVKDGKIPLCGESVPGVWWIEGEDGVFERDARGGRKAFYLSGEYVCRLIPLSPEIAADRILAHHLEDDSWALHDEVPF